MSDKEIALLVLGALASFFLAARQLIKWALERWEQSQTLTREAQGKGTDALIANTASNAVLIVKVDQLSAQMTSVAAYVEDARNEITGRTEVPSDGTVRRAPSVTVARVIAASPLRARTQGER